MNKLAINMPAREAYTLTTPWESKPWVITITPTEMKVLRFLDEGLSGQEMALRLNISRRTVDMHRKHLRDKFKVRSSIDLLQLAREAGILAPETAAT